MTTHIICVSWFYVINCYLFDHASLLKLPLHVLLKSQFWYTCKVKVALEQATKTQRGIRGIALPFLRPRHWRWGWVVKATPRPLYPRGMTWYPLYRRLGGTQGRSGRVRNTSPPPDFEHRIIEHVTSRYTDWATPAHVFVTVYYCQLILYLRAIISKNCMQIKWTVDL